MCIIAAKPEGISFPDEQTLKNMWNHNPDGAGFMFAANNKVHIRKGFMKYTDFRKALDDLAADYDLKKLSMVMHFRITTHGGTKPENCHPFPISDSIGMLKKLSLSTKLGVAHNGIINVHPRDGISDTMEYIAGQLAPRQRSVPRFYKDKNLMQMILHATDSKLAFLDPKGAIYTVGKFIEDKGILYSNNTYEHTASWRDFDFTAWENYQDEKTWTRLSTINGFNTDVMWLDDSKGEFVLLDDGSFEQGDFAIDVHGNVYEYDYDEDVMMLVYNAQALNSQGMSLRFNPDSDMVSRELVVW